MLKGGNQTANSGFIHVEMDKEEGGPIRPLEYDDQLTEGDEIDHQGMANNLMGDDLDEEEEGME